MNRYTKMISWGAAVLSLTAMSAMAQNTTPPNTTAAPATIGVSPQTAAEATRKAVPRSDTGTLVRTSPSPADKASAALNNAATVTPGNGAGTATTASTTARSSADNAAMDRSAGKRPVAGMRPARADRN